MKYIDVISGLLVIVGALNWGLVGIAQVDLVAALFGMTFGEVSGLSATVYTLVGFSALYQALFSKRLYGAAPAAVPVR